MTTPTARKAPTLLFLALPHITTMEGADDPAYRFAPSIAATHWPLAKILIDGVPSTMAEVENIALTMLHMVATHPEGIGLASSVTAHDERLARLLDIVNERARQLDQWGDQQHPDFDQWATRTIPPATVARRTVERKAEQGAVTWWDILREELAEAHDAHRAGDLEAFQTELNQAAAVLVAWAEDVHRRGTLDA